MMAKKPLPNKQVLINEVIQFIEQGKTRGEVITDFCEKNQIHTRTFDGYWKIASDICRERLEAAKKAADDTYIQMAVEAAKSAIMSKYERQKVLTDLARGDVEIEEVTDSSQFGTTVFKRLPNPAERRAAIAELNKMDGDYAPTKLAATDKDGNDKDFNITLNI